MHKIVLLLFLFFLGGSECCARDIILIKNPEQKKSEKSAILVLNGLGDSRKGRRHQKKFFGQQSHDIYIPDYISKKSLALCQQNAINFFEVHELDQYAELHIISYILGAWSINEYIAEKGEMNIKTIIYDRSPIQERAPVVVDDKIPFLGRLVAGKMLKDFRAAPYPPIAKGKIRVGLIVESKATSLMRKFEKYTLSLGPINWGNPELNQEFDDLIYTHLDHDEMYISFDEIGDEMMYFVEHGVFPNEARRKPFDWDPFVPYKKEK